MKRGDRIQVREFLGRNSEALRHNILTSTSHEVFFPLRFFQLSISF